MDCAMLDVFKSLPEGPDALRSVSQQTARHIKSHAPRIEKLKGAELAGAPIAQHAVKHIAQRHAVQKKARRTRPKMRVALRSIRPISLGRKNSLFMGSIGRGKAAAMADTLIETVRVDSVCPEVWLTWVLRRPPDPGIKRIDQLMVSNWKPEKA